MKHITGGHILGGLLAARLLAGCNGGGGGSESEGSTAATATGATATATATSTSTTTATSTDATSTGADTTPTTSADESTSGGVVAAKRVFVTAASFHGDLQQQGAGADGLAGADLLCAAAATSASLGGTWVAWVSTSGVDAISRLASDGRWTLIDEVTEVFASRSQIQFGPKHAIDVTEAGEPLLPSGVDLPVVWTNTDSFGKYSDDGENNACDDWSAQTGVAAVGVIFDPALGGPGLSWTDTKQPRACGGAYHLYCFEG
jgi:hypothetical protein